MQKFRKSLLKELDQQNEQFIRLFEQERYPEAIKQAESSLKIAAKTLGPGHPYVKIFVDNRKCAAQKFAERAENFEEEHLSKSVLPSRKNLRQEKHPGKAILLVTVLLACFILGFTVVPTRLETEQASSSFTDTFAGEYVRSPRNDKNIFAGHSHEIKEKSIIKAPLILQYPELPRGCEVTSLAMLLQYAGTDVDKMTLAHEIKKDPTPYQVKNGKVYFGNPYYGFVGNMYSLDEPGYGVYHGPIRELMEQYLPGQTIDLTGCDFEDLLVFLSEGIPVWVVANSTFSKLDDGQFVTWQTPQGPLQITYRMHAVLLTGYDKKYVYLNDPLINEPNRKIKRESFVAAWEQMGQQAVTYLPY